MSRDILVLFGIMGIGAMGMTGFLVSQGKLDSSVYAGILLPLIGAVGAMVGYQKATKSSESSGERA